MKRTDMRVCVGKDGQGYDIWRVVLTDGTDYFVKWKNRIINVNEDIENRHYSYR